MFVINYFGDSTKLSSIFNWHKCEYDFKFVFCSINRLICEGITIFGHVYLGSTFPYFWYYLSEISKNVVLKIVVKKL